MGLKESGLRGSLRSTSSVLPAFFDVTITNTNSPVQEGDILTVDYSANNTGDAQDTQDIRLEIDSVQEDVDPGVMLGGGASATGTLEWDTTGEAETTYSATVLSDDDSDSVTVEIEAPAIADSVIDDFEDYNGVALSDRYAGATDQYEISNTSFDGSQSLEAIQANGSIVSTDGGGLNDYPQQGDVFEGYVRGTSDSQLRTLYGCVDNNNYYQIGVSTRDNQIRFRKRVAGSETDLDVISASLSTNRWYRVEVSWDTNNNHNITVEDTESTDEFSVSATDSEFSNVVGFGLEDAGSGDGGGLFDGYRRIGFANE